MWLIRSKGHNAIHWFDNNWGHLTAVCADRESANATWGLIVFINCLIFDFNVCETFWRTWDSNLLKGETVVQILLFIIIQYHLFQQYILQYFVITQFQCFDEKHQKKTNLCKILSFLLLSLNCPTYRLITWKCISVT